MINNVGYTLGDYIDVARRRWIYLATVLPGAVFLALFIAYTLPALYRSSATIILERSSIPEDMVRTTVTAYADEQLELVWRRIMTNDSLAALIDSLDPYPNLDELSTNAKARLLREHTFNQRVDPITLEPLLESTAFSVHYDNPDPDIAATVADRLVEMFLTYHRESRAQQAGATHSFLLVQSRAANERILDLEKHLAEFRAEYGNAFPDAQLRNQQALDRRERDMDALQRQSLLAEERRSLLELQLSQINPNLFDPAGDWRAELGELRAELAAAQQRYTENHPDVIRLRRSIESMSARAALTPVNEIRPDNPDYIQVANQLETVKQELAVLGATIARTREQMAAYELSFQMAPDVEREYRQLIRDYDIAQERFRDVEFSLSEAALAEILESEERGAHFTLIRAPSRPLTPDSPNRLGIVLLGFVLGSALALGLVALAESSDPTIRSARDLRDITDVRPLGAIPFILNHADKRNRLLAWGASVIVVATAVTFIGSIITQA